MEFVYDYLSDKRRQELIDMKIIHYYRGRPCESTFDSRIVKSVDEEYVIFQMFAGGEYTKENEITGKVFCFINKDSYMVLEFDYSSEDIDIERKFEKQGDIMYQYNTFRLCSKACLEECYLAFVLALNELYHYHHYRIYRQINKNRIYYNGELLVEEF